MTQLQSNTVPIASLNRFNRVNPPRFTILRTARSADDSAKYSWEVFRGTYWISSYPERARSGRH